MKMERFQTFWIQMRITKPLDESRKTGQTSGQKWHFTLSRKIKCFLYRPLKKRSISLTCKENILCI
ncbi:hypothetical protein Hanom_Chr04g00290761 [Helianthus anomalus]